MKKSVCIWATDGRTCCCAVAGIPSSSSASAHLAHIVIRHTHTGVDRGQCQNEIKMEFMINRINTKPENDEHLTNASQVSACIAYNSFHGDASKATDSDQNGDVHVCVCVLSQKKNELNWQSCERDEDAKQRINKEKTRRANDERQTKYIKMKWKLATSYVCVVQFAGMYMNRRLGRAQRTPISSVNEMS